MSHRVLITGATGFVGSHILEALMKDPAITPIAACRDAKKLISTFDGEVRTGDMRDPDAIARFVTDVDTICHAGAWTSLWGHKRQSHDNYLVPTLALIDAAKKAGVTRFIFPSTTSAASPDHSSDPLHPGIPRTFWPHLSNVIAIENRLKERADTDFATVNLRLGLFVGQRYGLGILPVLLPRLKTHLVPWVNGGRTHLPLVDGRDIGTAFRQTVKATFDTPHEAFNIVGPEQPTVKALITFIHDQFGYPKPHFSVPFRIAYPFGRLMEALDPIVPWEPLVTRSIVHLMEETHADNAKAAQMLGYEPVHHWKDSITAQINDLKANQTHPLSMAVRA